MARRCNTDCARSRPGPEGDLRSRQAHQSRSRRNEVERPAAWSGGVSLSGSSWTPRRAVCASNRVVFPGMDFGKNCSNRHNAPHSMARGLPRRLPSGDVSPPFRCFGYLGAMTRSRHRTSQRNARSEPGRCAAQVLRQCSLQVRDAQDAGVVLCAPAIPSTVHAWRRLPSNARLRG